MVITAGSNAGALLVDGLGDGVLLEAPDQEVEFLRDTSFNLLQGCRMRNTKTVSRLAYMCAVGVQLHLTKCCQFKKKKKKTKQRPVSNNSRLSVYVQYGLILLIPVTLTKLQYFIKTEKSTRSNLTSQEENWPK